MFPSFVSDKLLEKGSAYIPSRGAVESLCHVVIALAMTPEEQHLVPDIFPPLAIIV